MNEILLGDIRDIAKTLPDQSVNCIVTSPPYFGLRDYGTAEWEGGKAECDHKLKNARNDPDRDKRHTDGRNPETQNLVGIQDIIQYSNTCPKCGAKRIDKQIGLEETPEAYVNTLVGIFRELKRVLRDDGTVWLNLGDSYAGSWGNYGARKGNQRSLIAARWHRPAYENDCRGWSDLPPTAHVPDLKSKNLIGIPWRVAFALQADGWILRSDIIWHKKNPMPESVKDRPTKAHEYIFLLSKQAKYYYDNEVVREASLQSSVENNKYPANRTITPQNIRANKFSGNMLPGKSIPSNPNGRNRRTVWSVSTYPYKAAHFAVFPPDLIRPCILAGCPPGGIVLDPFMGSGTVAQVAIETGRNWLGVELNPEYIELANKRIAQTQPALPIEMTL